MQQTVETVMALKAHADELITVDAGATVIDAVNALAGHRIGAVLIRNEDGLVDGIFTERDLLLRVVHAGLDPATTPISMVMTRDVRFVSPGTTVEAAMALMQLNRFRHLLVMDGPRVHGLVSMGDMTNYLIRHGEGRFEAAVRGRLDESAGGRPAGAN
ncbi:MAG: CBS domain-containing protein [Burkholderiales bacterium]|jgi:CBS domain-containing protein|nr:MAG: CBS domain-containing protein [Burkholderiales bacterium]